METLQEQEPTPDATPPKRKPVNPYTLAGTPLAFVVVAVPILSVIAAWNGWTLPEPLWQGWNVCIGGLIALNLRVGPRGDADRDGREGEKCK